MQELAKAQSPRRPDRSKPTGRTSKHAAPGRRSQPHPMAMAGSHPKVPAVEIGTVEQVWRRATERRFIAGAGVSIGVLMILLFISTRPSFSEGSFPPLPSGEPLPLPITPGSPIQTVFGTLGTQLPRAHPTDTRLASYSYGADLTVDALNGAIYQLTLRLPNRSWRGLRAGMSERNAEGELALMGDPVDVTRGAVGVPETVGNYRTFASLDARPTRTVRAEVRPPNGCYDVFVDLRQRAIGTLQRRGERLAVVARGRDPTAWAVTEIRVINRSVRDASGSFPAC